jgi:DNA invertase Pin-like site-specific DNA recombinase
MCIKVAVNQSGYRIGEDHPNAKLTNHEVDLIHQMREQCMSYAKIAEKFEISKSQVRNICKGIKRCHTVVGFKSVHLSS